MKRLLFISPHYPPDSAAGAHRARVIAPYLAAAGWQPLVLTLQPSAYEGELDQELLAMSTVSDRVEVRRAAALPARWTRPLGIGDLGLRSYWGLRAAADAELARVRYDAVYVTTYPVYPALLGPRLLRRFDVPFVLDLQDPWVGEWGRTVGGARDGTADLKSRCSRRALAAVERRVVPNAAALTSVSSGLLAELRVKYLQLATRPSLQLPIGVDPEDLEWTRRHTAARKQFFAADDGRFHLCCTGTLVPLARDVLQVVLASARDLLLSHPAAASRLRLHFIGTSNQAQANVEPRVLPIARALGVEHIVSEYPARVPFADALRCQAQASALLVLGSVEARYTASKVAPVLAAGRPVLALLHADSDAVGQFAGANPSATRVLTFREAPTLQDCQAQITETLRHWLQAAPSRTAHRSLPDALAGPLLAQRLAALLDEVVATRG